MSALLQLRSVLGAAHPGPAAAVTILTALLAILLGLDPAAGALVVAAVGAGQLSIGWSNDLIDAERDRRAGRVDKPVARGLVSRRTIRVAIAVVLVAAVGLSAACGWQSAAAHLALVVGSGWAYNLGLKATRTSWIPYAVAFGALPAVVSLAGSTPAGPPGWMVLTGALLGVGAHLLNALPDLADDAAAGVRGLPQRLGAARVRVIAPLVLLAGTAAAVVGPGLPVPMTALVVAAVAMALALIAVFGRGRVPFWASIGIALINVVGLLLR